MSKMSDLDLILRERTGMEHNITITTIEALLICNALGMDMQNSGDNDMANSLHERIALSVAKDLKGKKND